MRLFGASIRKIVLRPATRISVLVVAGIFALMYLGVGAAARSMTSAQEIEGVAVLVSFPDAYTTLVSILTAIASFTAAAWAGAIAGSEWSWNMLRVAVARGESRAAYTLMTLAAACLLLLVGWTVLFAVGVALAAVGGMIGGIAIGDPTDADAVGRLPFVIAAGWWSGVLSAAIGFGGSFIARSQVVGIVIVVGLYFGEQFAGLLLPPEILQYAPITVSSNLPIEVMGSGISSSLLGPLGVTTAYILIVGAVAAWYARRAEIA